MTTEAPDRRSGELSLVELLRWAWRQLTSMRTALILLLLLALASIPGSIIPQRSMDSLATGRWQDAHPKLTPIYEKLGLFAVFDAPWFAAIYILLMLSLVGCIIPRLFVYWRGMRAEPPRTPRNLARLPVHAAYQIDASETEVLDNAAALLKGRGFRVRRDADSVAAERGYLREAGNLLFHVSVLIVLVGFGIGSLFGYKGGVILIVGSTFSNDLTQYDDFDPGRLFTGNDMEPFCFKVNEFDLEWLEDGPRQGMAHKFNAHMTYKPDCDASAEERYDLQVNHPLSIGNTEVFLIGHGYAPVLTVRDATGEVIYRAPTIFLPEDSTFQSIGVVNLPDAEPEGIGLQGFFYPTYVFANGTPFSAMGAARNPAISMVAYTGDLGLDSGGAQSVYELDKANATEVTNTDGSMFRVDLMLGQTVDIPGGVGSVSFDDVVRWNKIQISRTPGKMIALSGVVLALLGLLGSLFIRPRRIWVRVRRDDNETMITVDVGGLDRSTAGDVDAEVTEIVAELSGHPTKETV